MLKRIWIGLALALVSLMVLSACGGGKLAEDLTPIPTLPPGEEPALAAPLESSAPVAEGGSLSEDELIALGEATFTTNCAFCHGPADGAGPAFSGMGARAAEHVEGQSAEKYLYESIVDPGAFVVEGFGTMPPIAGQLSDNEIEGLVAYILSQPGDEAAPEPTESPMPTETPESTEEPEPEPTKESEPVESSEVDVDLALGETLFASNCAACHSAADGAGPAFTGMGARATERIENMSAEDYLYESVVDPSAFVVDGYSDIMPKAYGGQLSDSEIASVVGYIVAETGDEVMDDSADTSEAEVEDDSDEEDEAAEESETEVVAGDPEAGEMLFQANCIACHAQVDGVGPALPNIAEDAAERVVGQSAEDYLHESIVDPSAFVVDGFGDIMPKAYGDQFSDEEIADLIAYILTQ